MERELLTLSGLQHFAYCRRQWALMYIEQQWLDNAHTAEGTLFHKRAHDEKQAELRGDTLVMRALRVQSQRLGVSGVCDVVEFRRAAQGIRLSGYDGLWTVYPVEYKKGEPKDHPADELQLCAQAMCLEEMLLCDIPEASLFYGETRRRFVVPLTAQLRGAVEAMLSEMRQMQDRGYTPRVKRDKRCRGCSLKEICLPQLDKSGSVEDYIRRQLGDDQT